ncbi:MAG: acyltransferase [Muribaculaceae bacterium]|nr:acyltransferase [Muribaculaceae bacterium]
MKSTVRMSNMELLRIVSMMMVLTVHLDGASLSLPNLDGNIAGATDRDWWRLIVEALAITGVNCFTMLSGYFGIRLTWRSALCYLAQCAFYAVGVYTIMTCIQGRFTFGGWMESWMVLTHTDLWYVPAYFMLMLVSPVLNAGLEALDRRRYTVLLAVFVLFTLWAGWWWRGKFNSGGYTAWQLVMVYCMARYMRRFECVPSRALSLLMFAVGTACIVGDACFDLRRAFAYNSPFVLLSTVGVFGFFHSLRFRSRFVNMAASGAFAVYLIHKNPLIWVGIVKHSTLVAWKTMPLWQFSMMVLIAVPMIYMICATIDLLRARLFDLIGLRKG